jgi:hypothetical protein
MNTKKISEMIGLIDNNIANINFDSNYIKDNFKLFSNTETIRKVYKTFYNKFNKTGGV